MTPGAVVKRGLSLYRDGLSAEKVVRRLREEGLAEVSPETVRYWVRRDAPHLMCVRSGFRIRRSTEPSGFIAVPRYPG